MIAALISLECKSLFGFQKFLHTKDPKAKRMQAFLYGAMALVLVFLVGNLCAQIYLLDTLGSVSLAPAMLVLLPTLLTLMLSLFGNTLYAPKGYELLWALPVKPGAVALARMIKLYVCYTLLTAAIMIPGTIVYGILAKPAMAFYFLFLPCIFLVPLLPLGLSFLMQTLIGWIAAHSGKWMKILLNLLLLMGIILIPMALNGTFSISSPEEIPAVLEKSLKTQFPFSFWPGTSPGVWYYLAVSVGGFLLSAAIICGNYGKILPGLAAEHKPHRAYTGLGNASSYTLSLYKKEAKGYFSCPIYVSNTVMGPILATIGSGALLFADISALPFSPDAVLPPLWCAICLMMNPAAVAFSMEGKEIWILKNLPVSMKNLVDAKLLWAVSLTIPAYVVSLPILIVSRETMHFLWFSLYPPAMILCGLTLSMAIGLRFQNYSWEKPEQIIKQSMGSVLGGLIPSLVSLAIGAGALFLPEPILPVLIFVPVLLTLVLYPVCIKSKLKS